MICDAIIKFSVSENVELWVYINDNDIEISM